MPEKQFLESCYGGKLDCPSWLNLYMRIKITSITKKQDRGRPRELSTEVKVPSWLEARMEHKHSGGLEHMDMPRRPEVGIPQECCAWLLKPLGLRWWCVCWSIQLVWQFAWENIACSRTRMPTFWNMCLESDKGRMASHEKKYIDLENLKVYFTEITW